MATHSKHRKNHKQKVAARNARIDAAKKLQQKRIKEYIAQLQKEMEAKQNENQEPSLPLIETVAVDENGNEVTVMNQLEAEIPTAEEVSENDTEA